MGNECERCFKEDKQMSLEIKTGFNETRVSQTPSGILLEKNPAMYKPANIGWQQQTKEKFNSGATTDSASTYMQMRTCTNETFHQITDGVHTLTWDDGSAYQGEFKNNAMDGEGFYLWPNGDVYVGNWLKGKRHGIGTFEYGKQWRYTGQFFEDQISGYGK